MKKSVSIIVSAAMAASLTLAGTINAFAADDNAEPTTEVTTNSSEETTNSDENTIEATDIQEIVGKWNYQEATDGKTVDNGVKDNGIVEVSSDGTFTYTDASGKTTSGTVKISVEELAGTSLQTINFYDGDTLSFGGYYNKDSETISIGNGGLARLVRNNEEEATTTASTETSTTTSTTTTTSATTTASSTTKAADKNASPKTGVAVPAITVAGLATAVAVAFALRKKDE